MKASYYLAIIQLIFFSLYAGCKPKNQSELKHEFGNLTAPPVSPVKDCDQNSLNKSLVNDYLYSIMKHIISSNIDFLGDQKERKICIEDTTSNDIDASARSEESKIRVSSGMILMLRTDSQLASVIAHELAHIYRNHREAFHPKIGSTSEGAKIIEKIRNFHPDSLKIDADKEALLNKSINLRRSVESAHPEIIAAMNKADAEDNKDEYFKQRQKINFILSRIPEAIDIEQKLSELDKLTGNRSIDDLEARLFEIEKDVLTKDERSNWKEREADEVGFEMYLRSGFLPYSYVKVFLNYLAIIKNEYKNCFDFSSSSFSLNKNLFQAGNGTHPTDCWRIYNIIVNETSDHMKEYSSFIQNNRTVNLSDDGLSRVRELILNRLTK